MSTLTDHVIFNDEKLARKYESERIPMSVLYEAYFDGDVDIKGDMLELLQLRSLFVKYTITRQHLQWAVTNFVPDMVHTKNQDEKMIKEVYDRGNDFFQWFLGSSMIYTAALFDNPTQPLEEAQRNQLASVTGKLQLKPGDHVLDVGCGWGTFVQHCAAQPDVKATGITLAEKQASYGTRRLAENGKASNAEVLRRDYRDLNTDAKYNKIVCMEMIEHVGMKNLNAFCEKIYDLLDDDGLFLLQWTGLRRSGKPEDLMWGLFINKYIFPGADASLPPSTMLKTLEKAGFEIHSVENISGHYACTLRAWYKNWQGNREAILAAYGERWFRIWNFFLAWSILIAEEGNAGCYQAVLNKNMKDFSRTRWMGDVAPEDVREVDPEPESTRRLQADHAVSPTHGNVGTLS